MTVYELIQALAYYAPNQEVVCKIGKSSTMHDVDYVTDRKYAEGKDFKVIIEVDE